MPKVASRWRLNWTGLASRELSLLAVPVVGPVSVLTRNIDEVIHIARVSGAASYGYTDSITLDVYCRQ